MVFLCSEKEFSAIVIVSPLLCELDFWTCIVRTLCYGAKSQSIYVNFSAKNTGVLVFLEGNLRYRVIASPLLCEPIKKIFVKS